MGMQAVITPGSLDVLMRQIRRYEKPVDLFVEQSGDRVIGYVRSAARETNLSKADVRYVGTYTPTVPAEYVRDDLAELMGWDG
jgi:hypothetical protein